MYSVPKPKSTNKAVTKPKLSEEDFIEIGETIAEAMEYDNEVEITVFFLKRFETVIGKITSADSQTGLLKLQVGQDSVRVNINSIVGIQTL